ncbi:Ig-like domain-containing protein [Clostridium luticellarii]|uniref:Ig-like domain-containing protein n=1 Tax=Clostridium luticellarii TaxID=1691940 RepID=UPI0023528EBA|nr:Ig-like domain-containing protein [Clostridium luticellarii]MCI1944763.1 Ig-like domain-containing protein [Clostridium luticellarii]
MDKIKKSRRIFMNIFQLLVIAAGVILFSQAFVQVSAKEAALPVITVSGLEDDAVVNSPNMDFTGEAENDSEGNLPVTVTLNGSPVEGQAENYALTLSEGQNTIVITAADSGGNTTSKTYKVTYVPGDENSEPVKDKAPPGDTDGDAGMAAVNGKDGVVSEKEISTTVNAEEVSPIDITLRATTPDENLIYPCDLTVSYAKFSNLGLNVDNDDPGFITPLHVLAAYYTQTQGATAETMKNYIQVNSDGTLKSIAGKNGLAVTKDTTKWMFSLNGIVQMNSEDSTVINSSTAVSLGRTNLGIYAYDSAITEAYFNFQNSNQMCKVGTEVSNFLNRSQKLLNNDVDILALKDTITPMIFREDGTPADPSDYILETETLSGTTGSLKITFNSPGVYYISAQNPVTVDGKTYNNINCPLEKISVYTEGEYNFRTDLNALNFNGGDLEFYKDETSWSSKTTGTNGSVIEWSSSDENRLSIQRADDATLKIVADNQGLTKDAQITVTAKVTLGEFTEEKTFECTVIADRVSYCLNQDYESATVTNTTYSNWSGYMSRANLCEGKYGSTYEFYSSMPDNLYFEVMASNKLGFYAHNTNLTEDTPIKIYIKVTYGGISKVKELDGLIQATPRLSNMEVTGVNNFVFDTAVYKYDLRMPEGDSITITPTLGVANEKYYITINGQKVGNGESYTYTIDKNAGINTVKIKTCRQDAAIVYAQYTINLSKEATALPDYTAFWGTGHLDDYNTRVVNALTPRSADEIAKQWNVAISTAGEGMSGWGKWSYPIVVNDNIYAAADQKLMKFDMDGNLLAVGSMTSGVLGGGYTGWLAYGEGKIFVPTGSGIMAFNADDLTQLWVGSSGVGGSQGSCPILYHDGYVYSGSTDANNGGGFYCFKAEDENTQFGNESKSAVWSLTNSSGVNSSFYWAGAAIVGDYLIVPCDSGYVYSISLSQSIEKGEPVIVDKINADGEETNIRTSIVYDETTKSIYYPTYAGKTYKVIFNEDGTFGEYKSIDVQSQCPTVYKGRLYITTNAGASVYDAETMELIYTAEVRDNALTGFVNGPTIVTAYATEENNQTVYIYGHTNSNPDTISVWKDSQTNNAENPGTVEVLYKNEVKPQFATSNVVVSEEGNLIFVNDSANLFCLKSGVTPVTGVTLDKATDVLTVGDTDTLTAAATPDNATDKNVIWSSSDETVAAVDSNGKVTALKAGTAVITVTTEDGQKTASCTVTVTADNGTKPIKITNLTEGVTYKLGEDAKVSIEAENNSEGAKDVSLIIALYDDNDKFISYTSGKQTVEVGKSSVLTGMLKLPEEGTYKLKAFVWDSLENMAPLSDVIDIPISSDI